ncbi:nuclear transport factor 2 family protein [Flavobacterium sp.]|uniref:nuclear transport factor 2 family protein n=1 Tax=Flavobacterium sp. TaxID=239 RepID=UPI00121A2FE4|nr:nuclear transport factor 2 family protein [Flavobacterium sp.]RZJ73039.1 MAG: nuclear transport factor 2 family protein [Flavobacterium sp.]
MTNKQIVLKAMEEFFHQRDNTAIERFWQKDYKQHNPSMTNGHDGLKDILSILDANFKWEPGIIVEQDNIVITHSLVQGWGPIPVIVVDIFRLEKGKIAEHWDVVQEAVPASKSASGNAMTSFDIMPS